MNLLPRLLKSILILAVISGLGGLFVSAETSRNQVLGLLLAGLVASAAVMVLPPVRQALWRRLRARWNAMASGNPLKVASVRLTGTRRGVDDGGHDTFCVQSVGEEEFFGEYFEVWAIQNENHFNIEIGAFGFTDPENAGNPYPSARLQFSTDECSTLEDSIRKELSKPEIIMDKWRSLPWVKFLGGVTFRPGWIIEGQGGPSARRQQLRARREMVNNIAGLVARNLIPNASEGAPALEARQSMLATMDRMLDGSVTYLDGARIVARLRFDADLEADSDILPFVGVTSETGALPLGRARQFLSSAALDDLQPRIREAEAWAKGLLENHCRNFIQRFVSSRETRS
jgi:hypothetical protein